MPSVWQYDRGMENTDIGASVISAGTDGNTDPGVWKTTYDLVLQL